MDIWLCDISRNGMPEAAIWLPALGQEACDKILRFRKKRDQQLTFTGEILLRLYAKERWGLKGSELERTYNPFGKPRLAHYPCLHYNISHSGHWVAVVFDEQPAGIDIEQVAPIDLSLADRFFSREEQKMLLAHPPEQQLPLFYWLWTLKESYAKAEGQGLQLPLDASNFSFKENGEIVLLEIKSLEKASPAMPWRFKLYSSVPDHALAVCAAHDCFPAVPTCIEVDGLTDRLRNAFDG